MNPDDFTLDEPITAICPDGYRFCPECGRYFHHPLRLCDSYHDGKFPQGVRTYKEKEMSWRKFIAITAPYGGYGPIWTLTNFLFGGIFFIKDEVEKHPERKKLYEEAIRIFYRHGGSYIPKGEKFESITIRKERGLQVLREWQKRRKQNA